MRRIMAIVFTVLPLFVVAQKKVAVMETTRMTNEVTMMQSQMVRGGLETAVANAPGYEGYDRTSFDAIMREQNFQRSGAVSDAQIKKLGEMAGVQYIIVSEASSEGGEFYVLVKMLDVETGKYGAAYDKLCPASATEIKKACEELGGQFFGRSNASSSGVAGNNKSQTSGTKRIQINYQDYEVLPGDLDGTYTWSNAKSACANLTAFGKSDWYLPNKEELNALYKRKDEIGGFTGDWYWSSSEYDSTNVWRKRFSDGSQSNYGKGDYRRVRCVRKN